MPTSRRPRNLDSLRAGARVAPPRDMTTTMRARRVRVVGCAKSGWSPPGQASTAETDYAAPGLAEAMLAALRRAPESKRLWLLEQRSVLDAIDALAGRA